ncbi:MAG: magnesium transporter [Hyphomicrobium zavarzinii]|jgi:magnesium transporter|uniref:magnesium transporter n=1 Tax=Hyphomicrobium TaxID=81 RepID=UPI00037B6A0E|nr:MULTISPECIES: magnesium transporter [Hyphomicrobium]MBL8846674.1 magnesium transporter [Hyphomicrobium zavarzinii]WBT39914.1 magnesium transporter [Hyphomicrobium sp. DMF-1]HML43266.1 magnesium transporter [Hyphomicrobium zavarzinii]
MEELRVAEGARLGGGLRQEHVADSVAQINELGIETAAAQLADLPLDHVIEIFDRPELARAGELMLALPVDMSGAVLKGMSADRATDTLRELDGHDRMKLLTRVDFETAMSLKLLLAYPEGTAGSLMTTEFVSVPDTYTVAQTLAHIRAVESSRETVYAILVLDPSSRQLVRVVSLRQLITSEPEQRITEIGAGRAPIWVSPDTDREEVARLISIHDLLAVPVLNGRHQVLGIVTVDDIIDAIVSISTEDVQKFGGVEGLPKPYLEIGFLGMIHKRAGWLCALFLGEMLTASAMQHFEDELAKAVVLTLFIPLIMSSGGNSGSQSTSLLIRALALGQLRLRDWWRVALREIPVGLTLGAILGVVGMVRIAVWQKAGIYDYGPHWELVALTVGLGLVGIVTFGALAGSMLPFVLKRLGFDPASASAPFVATLVDVTGLVIYFSVALVVLSGTLL